MTSKRQFLDPIGAGCRFVLLKSVDPNTKLKISNHTVQVVTDTAYEKCKRFINGDSREDIAVFYPVVVRFVELYLTKKKPEGQDESQSIRPEQNHQIQKSKSRPTPKPKPVPCFDGFGLDEDCDDSFGLSGLALSGLVLDQQCNSKDDEADDDYSQDIFDPSVLQPSQPSQSSQSSQQQNQFGTKNNIGNNNLQYNEECYEALKTIAQYIIEGMEELEVTYKCDNATFALQYFIGLLREGIKGTYTKDLLPKNLTDFTSQNFLDNNKIKDLWKDDDIIELSKLLKLCFSEKKNPKSVKAYKAAIECMLNDHDNIFTEMISSTNAS